MMQMLHEYSSLDLVLCGIPDSESRDHGMLLVLGIIMPGKSKQEIYYLARVDVSIFSRTLLQGGVALKLTFKLNQMNKFE